MLMNDIKNTLGKGENSWKIPYAALFALAFATILILYGFRLLYLSTSTIYPALAMYGVLVTPYLVAKVVAAHKYKPVPDVGYRPKVSIVIPVFNEEKHISSTITAILNSNYPKDKLEVIVVNDGSTDKTLQVISSFSNVKIINFSENRGKRYAFAAGVQSAGGEIIVCLDSDTIVDPDAIKNLVQPFIDPKVYCVCGHGEVYNNKSILTEFQRVWYADGFRLHKSFESYFGMVTCCSGLLAAYRKEKLLSILNDLLNESFLGRKVRDSDDRRITNLLLKMGGDSKYQSSAVAYTIVPETVKKFVKQQLRWGRGAFRGLLFALRFFWRRRFPQNVIFYLFVFIIYLTPIVVFINLILFPALGYLHLALTYTAGLLLVHFFAGLNDFKLVKNFTTRDVLFRTLFAFIAIALSFIYLYSWITVWKCGKWMTR